MFPEGFPSGELPKLSRAMKSSSASDSKGLSAEHQLFETLFNGYNKHIRPTMNVGDVSKVDFKLSILNVIEMVS